MHVVSNEERREVAEKLRALPIDVYAAIEEWEVGGLFIDESIGDEADYSQIHGVVLGCFPAEHMHPIDYKEIHERLAALIDRPTCNMDVMTTDERADYECSEHIMRCLNCGAEFGYVLYSEDGDVSMDDKPNYCPHCGTSVVSDDD